MMRSVLPTVIVVACLINIFLPESLGLRCYICTLGDKDGKPCEDFKKLSNDTEKQARFGTVCETTATGCAFTKANSGDGRIKLETEALSCYEPDEKLAKVVKMNECVEYGGASQKICVCNTGDYCTEGGSSTMGGVLGVVLILAGVARFI